MLLTARLLLLALLLLQCRWAQADEATIAAPASPPVADPSPDVVPASAATKVDPIPAAHDDPAASTGELSTVAPDPSLYSDHDRDVLSQHPHQQPPAAATLSAMRSGKTSETDAPAVLPPAATHSHDTTPPPSECRTPVAHPAARLTQAAHTETTRSTAT